MSFSVICEPSGALFVTLRMTAKNWCRTPKPVGRTTAAGMVGWRRFFWASGSPGSASGFLSPPPPSSSTSRDTPGARNRGGGPNVDGVGRGAAPPMGDLIASCVRQEGSGRLVDEADVLQDVVALLV